MLCFCPCHTSQHYFLPDWTLSCISDPPPDYLLLTELTTSWHLNSIWLLVASLQGSPTTHACVILLLFTLSQHFFLDQIVLTCVTTRTVPKWHMWLLGWIMKDVSSSVMSLGSCALRRTKCHVVRTLKEPCGESRQPPAESHEGESS